MLSSCSVYPCASPSCGSRGVRIVEGLQRDMSSSKSRMVVGASQHVPGLAELAQQTQPIRDLTASTEEGGLLTSCTTYHSALVLHEHSFERKRTQKQFALQVKVLGALPRTEAQTGKDVSFSKVDSTRRPHSLV
jgi:hypothetical protein